MSVKFAKHLNRGYTVSISLINTNYLPNGITTNHITLLICSFLLVPLIISRMQESLMTYQYHVILLQCFCFQMHIKYFSDTLIQKDFLDFESNYFWGDCNFWILLSRKDFVVDESRYFSG